MRSGRHLTNASTLHGWRKSSYSGASNGNCLEINRSCESCVPVRDSKQPTGPALVFAPDSWSTFLTSIREDKHA